MVRGEILISAVSSGETSHGACYDWQCEVIRIHRHDAEIEPCLCFAKKIQTDVKVTGVLISSLGGTFA